MLSRSYWSSAEEGQLVSTVPWFISKPEAVLVHLGKFLDLRALTAPIDNIIHHGKGPMWDERFVRCDRRAPEYIFQNGFPPRVTPDPDTANDAAFDLPTFSTQGIPSVFVSARRERLGSISDDYMDDGEWTLKNHYVTKDGVEVYEYVLVAPERSGINLSQVLGDAMKSLYPKETFAFPGGIRPEFIYGARHFKNGELMEVIKNPHFKRPAEHRPGHAPKLPIPSFTLGGGSARGIGKHPLPTWPPRAFDYHAEEIAEDYDEFMRVAEDGGINYVSCVLDPTNKDKAYFFCNGKYVLIKATPELGLSCDDDVGTVISGVMPLADNWSSLAKAGFKRGVDAVLPNPDEVAELYVFSDEKYALINIMQGVNSNKDFLVDGPKSIASGWPSLRKAGFHHIDAVLQSPVNEHEAYFFSGTQYVRVRFELGKVNDEIVYGPASIKKEWPSLTQAGFAKIGAILPHPNQPNEAYFFSESLERYALIHYKPATSEDYIVSGPKEVLQDWPLHTLLLEDF